MVRANIRRNPAGSVDRDGSRGYLNIRQSTFGLPRNFPMPIYEYRCAKCGVFEVMQKITESPLKKCPTCRGKAARIVSRSSFVLKGSGWYATDYAKKDKSTGKKTGEASSDAAPASGKSSESSAKPASSESKPASSKPASSKSAD
jgi:putative FmdB family regulatory protein